MCSYTTFAEKSICVRTHRAKSAHLPAEYIPLTFSTRTPPPFAQVDGGGCYREKFFWILFFLILARYSYLWIFFLFFLNPLSTRSDYTSILILFFRFRYRTRFDCYFDSRFILVWFWFRIYFISLRIMTSIWFSITILTSLLIYDSFLLASSYVDSTLCLFNSLSLWLFCLL